MDIARKTRNVFFIFFRQRSKIKQKRQPDRLVRVCDVIEKKKLNGRRGSCRVKIKICYQQCQTISTLKNTNVPSLTTNNLFFHEPDMFLRKGSLYTMPFRCTFTFSDEGPSPVLARFLTGGLPFVFEDRPLIVSVCIVFFFYFFLIYYKYIYSESRAERNEEQHKLEKNVQLA